MRLFLILIVAVALNTCALPGSVALIDDFPDNNLLGVKADYLHADFWISRQPHPERIILNWEAIAAQNRKLQELDSTVTDLDRFPTTLKRAEISEKITGLSAPIKHELFDLQGRKISNTVLSALYLDRNLDAIPESQTTRYGLISTRADLRTFPTELRVFSKVGDTDIDRFQESAVFPGTPVAILHENRQANWWFVVSPNYAAWIDKRHVAESSASEVLGYANKTPYLIVTGPTVRTVFNPELPAVSELQLDMGVRLPLLASWPINRLVNGQNPYGSYVIELPIRTDHGSLQLQPVLLSRTADVAHDFLPLTTGGLLRQSFKFLGERYGWGHSYNGRDCSGFVAEVYRSFGVLLPRNTSSQSESSAFNRITLDASASHEQRWKILRQLQVGDLLYIPGHVMMVIGHLDDEVYVIHDAAVINVREETGPPIRVVLNGVFVTPLSPLMFSENESVADRIYSIQRIRP